MSKIFAKKRHGDEEYFSILKKAFYCLKHSDDDNNLGQKMEKIRVIFKSNSHLFNEELPKHLPSIYNHFLNKGWSKRTIFFTSYCLGLTLHNTSKDTSTNLEIQIEILKTILIFFDNKSLPIRIRAGIHIRLGNFYKKRIKGDKKDNIEQTIHHYKSALKVNTLNAYSHDWAETQFYLGNAYLNRIKGDKKDNIEQAIYHYKSALEVNTPDANMNRWAEIQINLGSAYYFRIKGDKKDNIEFHINYSKSALEIFTREAYPTQWATTQILLGNAYLSRIKGDKKDNIELSINCSKSALEIFTREAYPTQWATTQILSGNAYLSRIKGDKKDNIEFSIQSYQSALEISTREAYPTQWATTQTRLGSAYYLRIKGNERDNIELSINCSKSALEVNTPKNYPTEWAKTQMNLGNAYCSRIKGNERDNIELSIQSYQSALEISTREAYPTEWAETQMNLGNAYRSRIKGDKRDNIELSIQSYQSALEVNTPENYPTKWAEAQINLGSAYLYRIKGDKKDNIELSIQSYKSALEVHTREAYPTAWATIQINLGSAYCSRIKGDEEDNAKLSIQSYKSALEVHTREAYPTKWAETQNGLGSAYLYRIKGDKGDNVELSIQFYKSALEVHTREAYPTEWAAIQNGLGSAYLYRIKGDKGDNVELSIQSYKSALEVHPSEVNPIKHNITTRNLGNLFFHESKWEEAIEAYHSGIEAIEITRNYASTDERRQEIQINALKTYNNLIQACLNTAQIEKAVEYSERFRSRMLVDLVSGKELSSAEVNDETNQLIKEFEELRQKIDLERQYLKSNDNNLNSDRSQYTISRAQLEESSEKIRQLKRERQNIHQQIRAQDPVMAGEIQVTPLPFAEIQKLIDNPQTAILSFYSTEEDTHIFIIYGDKAPQHYICQQQGYALHNWIREQWLTPYQTAFSQKDETLKQQWRESIPNFLQQLAHRLEINNLIAEYLTDIEELIIIPHLYLHNIPFAAIPISDSEYLGDRFRIRYAPSCQILQYCQEREPITEIKYGTVEDADNSLPGARVEGKKIAQIRNIEAKYRLIGKDNCSVGNYRQLSKDVQVLHSSHHAVSRLDNPLESSLNLGDGNITLGELLLWRRKKLLETFLSACETNLGITEMGDDVLTLASGFLCAGARAVVSSLWVADDLAATLLSIFYHQLRQENKSRSEALQLAQQKLRNLSGDELKHFYERELKTDLILLRRQTEALHGKVEKELKLLSKNAPNFEKVKEEYEQINVRSNHIHELQKLAKKLFKQPLPFAHPYYWSVFICSGMS